jgi:hypothetical protein
LAEFDINKLSTGDKLILGGGIAFVLFMFFPWYGLSGGSNNGFHYFLFGLIPLLLIILTAAVVAVRAFAPDTKLPELPIAYSLAMLIASGLAALLVLLKVAIGDSVSVGIPGFSASVDLDRKFGIFLAFLSAAAVAAGAYMKYQAKDDAGAAPSGPPTAF